MVAAFSSTGGEMASGARGAPSSRSMPIGEGAACARVFIVSDRVRGERVAGLRDIAHFIDLLKGAERSSGIKFSTNFGFLISTKRSAVSW